MGQARTGSSRNNTEHNLRTHGSYESLQLFSPSLWEINGAKLRPLPSSLLLWRTRHRRSRLSSLSANRTQGGKPLILSCGMAPQACQAVSPDGNSRCMPRSVSAKLSWPWSCGGEGSRAIRWRSQCMTNLCDWTYMIASSRSQDSVGAVILKQ